MSAQRRTLLDVAAAAGLALGGILSPGQALATDPPHACVRAKTPDSELNALPVSATLAARLASYRQGWRALCANAPGRPSVERLLREATELAEAVPSEAAVALGSMAERDPGALPGLGPGLGDSLYVEDEDFREAAMTEGTEEDRYFWSRYPKFGSLWLPPWIQGTWDYGGCPRFGEYDWIAGLEALADLRARALGPTYSGLVQRAEALLWEELEASGDVCTCGATTAVVPDMQAILRFVRRAPGLRAHAARLQARVRAIEDGSVVLRSEVDGHCSGG